MYNKGKPIPLIPITLKDNKKPFVGDNLDPHPEQIVYVKNVRYISADEIKPTDIESCAIPKFNSDFPVDIWGQKNES